MIQILRSPSEAASPHRKNRKNVVKMPPSTTPSRATSPMSLGRTAKRDSPLSGAADRLDKASNKAKMALQHVFSSRGLQPWNASSERAIDVVHSVRMGQHPEGGAASCLPLVRICQQVLCDTPPASATCAFIKPVLSGAKPACLDEELSASDSYQDEHWERRVS